MKVRSPKFEVRSGKVSRLTSAATGLVALALLCAGCGALDRAYNREVTWEPATVVQVYTNTVREKILVPQVPPGAEQEGERGPHPGR